MQRPSPDVRIAPGAPRAHRQAIVQLLKLFVLPPSFPVDCRLQVSDGVVFSEHALLCRNYACQLFAVLRSTLVLPHGVSVLQCLAALRGKEPADRWQRLRLGRPSGDGARDFLNTVGRVVSEAQAVSSRSEWASVPACAARSALVL